jgi:hypothetical protein
MQTGFLVDILFGDILSIDAFAFHAQAELSDLGADFLELFCWCANTERGAGRVSTAINVRGYEESSCTSRDLYDFLGSFGRSFDDQAKGLRPY